MIYKTELLLKLYAHCNVDSDEFCLQNTIGSLSYLLVCDETFCHNVPHCLVYFVSLLWNVKVEKTTKLKANSIITRKS